MCSEDVERRAHALGQLLRRSGAVVVQEEDGGLHSRHVVVDRHHLDAGARSALSTGVTSVSSIATSPATIASASVPAKAAHVLSPIRAVMAAPMLAEVDVGPADGDLVDRS